MRCGLRLVAAKGRRAPTRQLVIVRPFAFDAAAARERFEPFLRAARDEGLVPVVSFERLSGHPFSGGRDAGELADRVRAVFPEGRVLVVIREQRSMIVSTYKQYVEVGGPCSLRSFVRPPASPSMKVPWFDLAHFEYHHLLRYYRALFGEENVLALAFEQFLADPRGYVETIARFAGVAIADHVLDELPYDERSNVSLSAVEVALRRRANRLAVRSELHPAPVLDARPTKRLARAITGLPAARWLPASIVARSEESLRREAAELVGDRYRESNRITDALTGIDLGAYGWTV